MGCTIDTCSGGACFHAPDDAACDDGITCTLDVCSVVTDCSNTFGDAACDDGIACTTDTCDVATDTCSNVACDSVCDDGSFCDGVERCDTTLGCTAGPPACDLGLPCSHDHCTEATQKCTHAGAPICTPSVHLLVDDASGALLDVDPYRGTVTTMAVQPTSLFDVAILGGRWFGLNPAHLYELAPGTGQIVKSFPALGSANSLGAGPDGKLYAADTQVYRADPDTGAAQVVAQLPPGHTSSGDIAFLGSRMFVSTDGPCGGALVEIDLGTGTASVLGGDGLGCVYGLAAKGGKLFIVNCDGKVGTFDPLTGTARVLSTIVAHPYGADALP